jgi:uncharacterized membrane-anchored protein YitT (DUF2179 family)
VTGALLVSLGTVLFGKAMLLTGGTVGMGLLLQFATGLGFGFTFFAINLPFYVLAWLRMGRQFTARTAVAVTLVSLFNWVSADLVHLDFINPLYATVMGGLLAGIGLLVLFRHRTGLGGTNILALYLHEKLGWKTGHVQLAIDLMILATAFFVLPVANLALSVVGAVIVNLVLMVNHRSDRYVAVS